MRAALPTTLIRGRSRLRRVIRHPAERRSREQLRPLVSARFLSRNMLSRRACAELKVGTR